MWTFECLQCICACGGHNILDLIWLLGTKWILSIEEQQWLLITETSLHAPDLFLLFKKLCVCVGHEWRCLWRQRYWTSLVLELCMVLSHLTWVLWKYTWTPDYSHLGVYLCLFFIKTRMNQSFQCCNEPSQMEAPQSISTVCSVDKQGSSQAVL